MSNPSVDPVWAWARYEPGPERPWNLALASHLYRRAAFGGTWGELQRGLAEGPRAAVDRLLQPPADTEVFNRQHDQYEAADRGDAALSLRAWWLQRMAQSPHPLLERMTFFWAGHFATSNAVVSSAPFMSAHVQGLRRHALGRWPELLRTVYTDPAVLLGLGAGENRKARPNEDFARTLLEHFGVGAGQFTEADVRDTARAYTGWFKLRQQLRFIEREYDAGVKEVLGERGPLKAEDVARVVAGRPEAARLVVRKLYRALVSETDEPPPRLLAPLADALVQQGEIAPVVETVLRSNLFFSPAAYRQRVKSPVELAVGAVRALEAAVPWARLAQDVAELGQNLYHPPTVRGWAEGNRWINTATLVARANWAATLLSGAVPYGERIDPRALAARHGREPDTGAFLAELLLGGDGADRGAVQAADARAAAYELTVQPEYQLA